MTLFFILAAVVAYLSIVAGGIALAGRWHGKALAERDRHPKFDNSGRFHESKNKDWEAADNERVIAQALAWLSAIWPLTLTVVIIAGIVGGTIWSATTGVRKLFTSQSHKAITLEKRKIAVAALNKEIATDKKKVLA